MGEEKGWAVDSKNLTDPAGRLLLVSDCSDRECPVPSQMSSQLASLPSTILLPISKRICLTGAPQVLAEEGGRSRSHLPGESNLMSFRAGILPPNPSFFDKSRNHPLHLQTAVQSLYITLKIN